MTNNTAAAAFGLPYSTIRKVGDFYYLSGHTGVNIETKTAAPDVKSQTEDLFRNLADTMKVYDLRFDDFIKTTVFLTDMGDFAEMNSVYVTYFKDPRPTRSTVAIRELPRVADVPLLVEIEAIAYKISE